MTPTGRQAVDDIAFALVLNLHQPAGNLEDLLGSDQWEATEILYALDRIPRSLWPYQDIGRVHLAMSGTLLKTLADPAFQARVYGIVDCGSLLWHLQNTSIIDILGSAYYHPVLPLVPSADWPQQLQRWRGVAEHLFARSYFGGFWPPEMGFTMELIPFIRALGYRYVLVDANHVEPVDPMRWDELRYRPHIARHDGAEIVVVVRDRELSDAQESGMDADWFIHEVQARTRHCDFTPLVTTCTDGDNGGWFRNATPGASFWSAFYQKLLDRVRDTPKRRNPPRLHPRAPRDAWRARRGAGQARRLEHRLARRDRLHPVDRLAHATRRPGQNPGRERATPRRGRSRRFRSPAEARRRVQPPATGADELQLLLGRDLGAPLLRGPRPLGSASVGGRRLSAPLGCVP